MKAFTLILAAVAAALLAPLPASAQKVDVSAIKCKEFLALGKDNITIVMMWLDGYYTGEDDPSIIDFDAIAGKVGKMGEYCNANPDNGLITAADAILTK
jgi:acid stress chaperone HdeB